mmetsp:Transcript_15652/g.43782  ORF Transcript_15652/g.43782 Transcript_15652/m.43782 type:complete len:218 (+) Transcript_15652:121-774(+)
MPRRTSSATMAPIQLLTRSLRSPLVASLGFRVDGSCAALSLSQPLRASPWRSPSAAMATSSSHPTAGTPRRPRKMKIEGCSAALWPAGRPGGPPPLPGSFLPQALLQVEVSAAMKLSARLTGQMNWDNPPRASSRGVSLIPRLPLQLSARTNPGGYCAFSSGPPVSSISPRGEQLWQGCAASFGWTSASRPGLPATQKRQHAGLAVHTGPRQCLRTW